MKNGSLFAFFHLISLGLKLGVIYCQMLLLQFSTSPYCRKVRLALGYKGIPFQVENLTPGPARFETQASNGGFEDSAGTSTSTRQSTAGDRRLDANLALDRVSLSFPVAVARRREFASRGLDAGRLAR